MIIHLTVYYVENITSVKLKKGKLGADTTTKRTILLLFKNGLQFLQIYKNK